MSMINECTDDMETLYEELYTLREKVFSLEKENSELRHSLSSVKELKEQLELSLVNTEPPVPTTQKRRQKTPKHRSLQEIQMIHYYRCNKDNPSLINKIKKDLDGMGYSQVSPPWQIVKSECDKMFMTLTDSEKQKYS
jgi:regulator of replication initiation timing